MRDNDSTEKEEAYRGMLVSRVRGDRVPWSFAGMGAAGSSYGRGVGGRIVEWSFREDGLRGRRRRADEMIGLLQSSIGSLAVLLPCDKSWEAISEGQIVEGRRRAETTSVPERLRRGRWNLTHF